MQAGAERGDRVPDRPGRAWDWYWSRRKRSPAATASPVRAAAWALTGRAGSSADRTRSIGAKAQSGLTGTHRPWRPGSSCGRAPGTLPVPAAGPRPAPRRGPGTAATPGRAEVRAHQLSASAARAASPCPAPRPDEHDRAVAPQADPLRQHQLGQQRAGQPDPQRLRLQIGLPLRSSCAIRYRSSATSPVPLSPAFSGPGYRWPAGREAGRSCMTPPALVTAADGARASADTKAARLMAGHHAVLAPDAACSHRADRIKVRPVTGSSWLRDGKGAGRTRHAQARWCRYAG